MPYNGVGLFTSLGSPTFPAVPNTYILASYFNATMDDIFAGLSSALPRDGQAAMAGALPMGGNKITGLAAGAVGTDAVNFAQVFTAPTFTEATLVSPILTGLPTAPTAAALTPGTQIATLDYVLNTAFALTIPAKVSASSSLYLYSILGAM